jgi:hypothetical protein
MPNGQPLPLTLYPSPQLFGYSVQHLSDSLESPEKEKWVKPESEFNIWSPATMRGFLMPVENPKMTEDRLSL